MSVAILAVATSACATAHSPGGSSSASPIAGGSPWIGALSPVALPVPVNSLTAVTCATANRCWAVGSTVGGGGAPNGAAIVVTTDGGAKWTTQVIPATVGYLSGLACSDQRRCIAVGQASQTSNGQAVIIATSNGGATWTQSVTPSGILDITAVSCLPDHRCVAIGVGANSEQALTSAAPVSGWVHRGTLPPALSGATAISCSDDRHCWVTAHTSIDVNHVEGSVAVTTDGGGTWTPLSVPKGTGYLNGVSCLNGPTTGAGALPFTTATTTLTSTPTAPGTDTTTSTVRSSTTTSAPKVGVAGVRCTVVGTTSTSFNSNRTGHGLILTTENGGASWRTQHVAVSVADLLDISCMSIGSCVSVGSSIATSAQAGVVILTGSPDRPWKGAAVVGSVQPLSGVSCISDSHCVVVGESISEHLVGS